MKKIALIVNGTPDGTNPTLAGSLRKPGIQVDEINLDSVEEHGSRFFFDGREIDPRGYDLVMRSVMGGPAFAGDTDKSLRLQRLFEQAGVKPHIPADLAETIVDKIKCHTALQKEKIPVVDAVYAKLGGSFPMAEVEAMPAPYVVMKSIGSGKGSAVIAWTKEEAEAAAEKFANGSPPRGAIIQHYTQNMTKDVGDFLEVNPTNRHCHFRIMMVGGKPFGASVFYTKHLEYALNPEQGALVKPMPLEALPKSARALAEKAANKLGASSVAAVDIIFDENRKPYVLDMNVSPNLSIENARGQTLMDAVAANVQQELEKSGRGLPSRS